MYIKTDHFPKPLSWVLMLGWVVFSFAASSQDLCQSLGWANYDGNTFVGAPTGGGNAAVTQVTTFAALKSAAESSDARVIHVMNSMGNGFRNASGDVINVKSNKTIIGVVPGITIKSAWKISNASNVIIRNLKIEGPGNSNSEQNWDCVTISGSKRIWVDHCVVENGEDGNFDIVQGADNISVTWTIFTYTANGPHNFSNLIGSSDNEPNSHGKLNTSYINCWWRDVTDRCPRTRYGKIHMVNCLYSRPGGLSSSNGTAAGLMASNRVENCHFDRITNPCKIIGTPATSNCTPIGCKFTSCTGTTTGGSTGGLGVFTPPYEYSSWMVSADAVQAQVERIAGNNLTYPFPCGQSNTDCNGVQNGTATFDNCGRCVGGNSGKAACVSVGEAEVDACTYEGTVDNNNAGFKGAGFVNVPNAIGASITFHVWAASAGSATLSFRYANGGTADRPAQILLNNSALQNLLSFPVTGSFTTWKAVDLTLGLKQGVNSLTLAATASDGLANIDQIGYVTTGVSKGNCVVTSWDNASVESTVLVFPNPSKSSFLLRAPTEVNVQVFDAQGHIHAEFKNVSNIVFGEDLNPGFYFLKTGGEVYKLVKE